MEESSRKTTRYVDITIGVIVAVLNIVEIRMLTRKKRRNRRPYESLLLSLSITDLLFGLSNIIISIVFFLEETDEEILELTYTSYFFFVFTSILHLSLLSFDRVQAIAQPLKHRIYWTRKKLNISVTCIWVFSFVISVTLIVYDEVAEGFTEKKVTQDPNVSINNTSITNNNNTSLSTATITNTIFVDKYPDIMTTTLASIIVIADVFFIISNAFIIHIMQNKKNTNKNLHINAISGSSSSAKEDKASLVCLCIALVFVLFTLPYAVLKFTRNDVTISGNFLLVANSAMNSIVYFFRGKIEKLIPQQKQQTAANSGGTGTTSTPLDARKQYALHNRTHDNKVGSQAVEGIRLQAPDT